MVDFSGLTSSLPTSVGTAVNTFGPTLLGIGGRKLVEMTLGGSGSFLGFLRLDALISEHHQGSSTVTQYPVETGFPVSDNIGKNSDTLSIQGVVTGIYPFSGGGGNLPGGGASRLAFAKGILKLQHDLGIPVIVMTGMDLYLDYAIQSYSIERTFDNGERIDIACELIQIRKAIAQETDVPEAVAQKGDEMSGQDGPDPGQGGSGGSAKGDGTGQGANGKAGATRTNAGKADPAQKPSPPAAERASTLYTATGGK